MVRVPDLYSGSYRFESYQDHLRFTFEMLSNRQTMASLEVIQGFESPRLKIRSCSSIGRAFDC